MTNTVTKQPLKIVPNGQEGGWLQLPDEQVEVVLKLFQEHGLRCWRTPVVWSADGGPALGSVILSRNVKSDAAQAALDSVP